MAYMSEYAEWQEEFDSAFAYLREEEEEDYQNGLTQYLSERESGEVKNVRQFAKNYGLTPRQVINAEITVYGCYSLEDARTELQVMLDDYDDMNDSDTSITISMV